MVSESSFKVMLLKDILIPKGYIRGPFGSALRRGDMLDSGTPVYEQQNAIYDHREFRYFVDDEKVAELSRFLVQPGDIVISCSGTVGKTTLIKDNDPIGIISQALLLLRANSRIIRPKYLQYYFMTNEGFNSLVERSHGSVQANIAKREVVESIELKVPPLPIQDEIISIIDSFSNKLSVLNKINDNLSEQGQAIFNELIINGEAASEERLTDIAHFQNGLPMQKNRPIVGEGLPVLKIKELGQGRCDDSSERCRDDIDHSVLINNGDVVFSWSGSLMAKIWCGGKCGLNQHLFKVTSEKYPLWFYYYWLQYHLPDFINIAANKATTMGHICRNHLDDAIVSIPRPEIMKKADSVLSPIIKAQIKSMEEITQLTVLRDYLLPKLMSGQIEV